MSPPAPSPYRVTTITSVCGVCTQLDLYVFFNELPITEQLSPGPFLGITYAELIGGPDGAARVRGDAGNGTSKAAKKRQQRSKELAKAGVGAPSPDGQSSGSKFFSNQATVLMWLPESPARPVNMKVFRNGRVQMTGLTRPEHGQRAVGYLLETLLGMHKRGLLVATDPTALAHDAYRVCLITSDMHLGFPVRREQLVRIVRGLNQADCQYEPCLYPAVKIQFMCNTGPHVSSAEGGCRCAAPCAGRGGGHGDGGCRKVTIMVFQSGSVIITGCQTMQQMDAAYHYLTQLVVVPYFDQLLRPLAPPVSRGKQGTPKASGAELR